MSFKEIFKKGSRTYYNSSKFFPKDKREDIEILYAFVRTVDDYVDKIPQDKKSFYAFKKMYYSLKNNKKIIKKRNNVEDNLEEKIIIAFIDLCKRKKFDQKWTDSFLLAMESDIKKKKYYKIEEVEEYMHGSAEVIGLFMNRILGISQKADKYAKMLGKSMQYINFIRDIKEDYDFNRTYLPINDAIKIIREKNIMKLDKNNARDKEKFIKIIRFHIDRYRKWQMEAEKGFKFIPKKYLIAIKTASDMYNYIAEKIYQNPTLILKKKVRPGRLRILFTALRNSI